MVIDNLGAPKDIPLAHYLPSCDHGHVIVTSRDRGWAALADAWIELGEMGAEESVQCVLNASKIERTQAITEYVVDMVKGMMPEERIVSKLVEVGRQLARSKPPILSSFKPSNHSINSDFNLSGEKPYGAKTLMRFMGEVHACSPSSPTISEGSILSDIEDEGEKLVGDLIRRRRDTVELVLSSSETCHDDKSMEHTQEEKTGVDVPPTYEQVQAIVHPKGGLEVWKYVLLFLIMTFFFILHCTSLLPLPSLAAVLVR